MTNYVIDASVVAQLVITDVNSAEVEVLFRSVIDGNTLVIPEFGLTESTNVLWKHVRFHNLTRGDAESLVRDLITLDIVIAPTVALMPRALEIGLTHQIAIYDSIYIALAEKLNHPLITVDQKQAKVADAEGVILLKA